MSPRWGAVVGWSVCAVLIFTFFPIISTVLAWALDALGF